MNKERLLKGKIPGEATGIEIKKSMCDICTPTCHCGLDVYVKDGKIIKVEGNQEHKTSHGSLCSKGASTRQYVYSPDRIMTPLKRVGPKGSSEFLPISWEEAYTAIAEKFNALKAEGHPEYASFFVGYSKWMRPYVQRLCRTFGSPNYSTESSTCFKAMYLAWKLVYGTFCIPQVPVTDCLLIWSNNPFHTGTASVKGLLNRLESGMKLIVVDPRPTPTANRADIHLQLKPGTDGALALAMAHVIIEEDLYDKEFVENYSVGFEEYRDYVKEWTPEKGEEVTGVPADLIRKAARMYAGAKTASIMPSASPVVHHTNGTQAYRAIFMLAGLTGNFDIPGGNVAVKFSYLNTPAGFPTREAEYMEYGDLDKMAPRIGSEKWPIWMDLTEEGQAVAMPDYILTGKPYPIKAVMAFGMNYRMWPDSERMKKALEEVDFFVDIDLFMTDTAKMADIVLPACSSLEREEFKAYGGGYVLHTKPVIEPLGQSKPDTQIICELAKYLDVDDDLLTKGYEANINWILEPSGMTRDMVAAEPNGMMAPGRKPPQFQKYKTEGFHTPSGKFEFVSGICAKYEDRLGIDALPKYLAPGESSGMALSEEYPFILNTGSRLPMYIHSRTFRLPWTTSFRPEPMADIHPADAQKLGIVTGDPIKISTKKDSICVKANVTELSREGVIFMYHAYPEADVNRLIDGDYCDPVSGFPGYKSIPSKLEKLEKEDCR